MREALALSKLDTYAVAVEVSLNYHIRADKLELKCLPYVMVEQLKQSHVTVFSTDGIPFAECLLEQSEENKNFLFPPSRNAQNGVEDRRSLETSPSILDCSCGADRLSESIADAKLYEYRGKTIAGFELHGVEMMCLPQAFETFLKDLLGGLHTVYTKLKRLQIQPVVCNVEQVRALRSLGAIQQGVNRCKLISRNDFDRLYDDCCNI